MTTAITLPGILLMESTIIDKAPCNHCLHLPPVGTSSSMMKMPIEADGVHRWGVRTYCCHCGQEHAAPKFIPEYWTGTGEEPHGYMLPQESDEHRAQRLAGYAYHAVYKALGGRR